MFFKLVKINDEINQNKAQISDGRTNEKDHL